MSLSRAFTTRRIRMSFDSSSSSSADPAKAPRGQPLRHKISAPMQLLHTTNLLSYNAPDLPRPAGSNSPISVSYSSAASEQDSDSIATAETTPPTSPDAAKGDRKTSMEEAKSDQVPGFFSPPARPLFPEEEEEEEEEAPPAIPQRAPSHTKKNSYDAIARRGSVSHASTNSDASSRAYRPSSRSSCASTRASSVSAVSSTRSLKHPAPSTPTSSEKPIKESHPFGPELAQVTELAEEYSGSNIGELESEDAQYLQSKGLSKFSAEDYMSVIHEMSACFFPEVTSELKPSMLWI